MCVCVCVCVVCVFVLDCTLDFRNNHCILYCTCTLVNLGKLAGTLLMPSVEPFYAVWYIRGRLNYTDLGGQIAT